MGPVGWDGPLSPRARMPVWSKDEVWLAWPRVAENSPMSGAETVFPVLVATEPGGASGVGTL
jgi:hypothetical protein